MTDIVHLS